MRFIDTHFHLDFYPNHKLWYDYINSCKQYTLCVTNSPEVFYSCKRLYPETKYLKFALGYNPRLVIDSKFNVKLFNYLLEQTKYIGEIGLDFSKEFKNHKSEQMEYFDYICSSISDEQILSVHSKNAAEEVLKILQKNRVKKAVLHWYSGDLPTLKRLVEEGYYFSVNSKMINSIKGQNLIKNIPLDKLLIESDGPFTKINSKKYTPAQLPGIYHELASLLKHENIEELIWNNFKTLIS